MRYIIISNIFQLTESVYIYVGVYVYKYIRYTSIMYDLIVEKFETIIKI